MDMPTDLFVKPLDGNDEYVAFQFPINLEGKALDDGSETVLTVLDDGDLLIKGMAAEFEGTDRDGENFTEGAFQRGIKSFLDGPASLCYHHKNEKLLGKVLDLKEIEGKGLEMTARVDGAIQKHPELGTIYEQIKKGTLSGLSVGGFFKRIKTPAGPRISDMDFTEISITPVPTHTKPKFAIVAGKALEDFDIAEPTPPPAEDVSHELETAVNSLTDILARASDVVEGKAVKGPKGKPHDLAALSTVIGLEQHAQGLPDDSHVDEKGNQIYHPKVIALSEKVKENMKSHAKEAHQLSAKLGPIPAPYTD